MDRAIGFVLLAFSIALYVYYSLWVLVTPFVEDGHFLLQLFPDKHWAIIIPSVTLIVGLSVIGALIGLLMIKGGAKTKPKAS